MRVEVGTLARLQPAAITEAEEVGGLAGQALDDEFERQACPTLAIARPVGQHVARHAGLDVPCGPMIGLRVAIDRE
jgi:hypothetical protein